ncbi:TPA: hypothetical protein QDB09_003242 [Burkholderia vietnamiensis]|nr:hypothetical protein [Burkholderia vietnamiensis]
MKKLLTVAAMVMTHIAHAEKPITCEERYETSLMMESANQVCGFAQEIQDSIARFKADALQQCGSSLSSQTRDDIDKKSTSKINSAFKKYGEDGFCTRVANAIYKSDPNIKRTDKSNAHDVMLVMSSKQPTDGIIKNEDMLFMLDPKISCPFPVAGWESMHVAFIFNRALKNPVPGCWGMTNDPSGAEAIIVGSDGSVQPSVNLMNLQRVRMLSNGDGKILGPAMTYDQYQKNIADYKKQFR